MKLQVPDETLRLDSFTAESVDAGETHACAVLAGELRGLVSCWGAAATGQLGPRNDELFHCPNGEQPRLPCGAPGIVDQSLRFLSVSAGWDVFVPNDPQDADSARTSWLTEGHTCGIAMDSTAYCWGKNDHYQLGTAGGSHCTRVVKPLRKALSATVLCRAAPQPVMGSTKFKAVSAGSEHTCAITTDDLVYCWGNNADGQLGDGAQVSRPTPSRIKDIHRYQSISAGPNRTCGVTLDDGKIFCWGKWDSMTRVTPTIVEDPT